MVRFYFNYIKFSVISWSDDTMQNERLSELCCSQTLGGNINVFGFTFKILSCPSPLFKWMVDTTEQSNPKTQEIWSTKNWILLEFGAIPLSISISQSEKVTEIIIRAIIWMSNDRLILCSITVIVCLPYSRKYAAARLLTNTSRRSHITPVLASLHWLSIKFCINFKILLITYKALHGLAPPYISELLSPYNSSQQLRSSDQDLLSVLLSL